MDFIVFCSWDICSLVSAPGASETKTADLHQAGGWCFWPKISKKL
jgi:hypothetical protein